MSQITPSSPKPIRYTDEEVKAILEKALGLEGKEFTRTDLLVMAQDLGISAERLELAEQAYFSQVDDSALEQEFIRERRKQFAQNLASYMAVAALAYLGFISDFAFLPVLAVMAAFPLIFGGIALVVQGVNALFITTGDEFEEAFDQWHDKRESRRRKRLTTPS